MKDLNGISCEVVFVPPSSSIISKIGYNYSESTLVIEYKGVDGNVYTYDDVPEMVYEGALLAPSVGAYVNLHITAMYDGIKHEVTQGS